MSKQNISQTPNKPIKGPKKSLPWPWLCPIAMAAVTYILCGIMYPDYVRKLEDLSFFMPGSWFFGNCMMEPDGLITWVSTFMTQFFYYPWLGATAYTIALAGLWILISWAFALKRVTRPLAGVVPVMMLLFAFMPGYLIFMAKTPGFAWTGIWGFAVSALYFGIWRIISSKLWRIVVIIVFALTYPLFGVYALWGTALCVICELVYRRGWIAAATGILLICAIPQLYFRLFESHAMASHLYLYGIPRMALRYLGVMTPYWISFGVMFVLALMSGRNFITDRNKKVFAIISSLIFAVALASVFVFCYKDRNFHTTVGMEPALRNGDYKTALEIVDHKEDPHTRVVLLLTHAALYREGSAGDKLFRYRMSDAPYNTPYAVSAMRLSSGRSLNYLFGRLNDAYRWCMEDMVEYGYKVEYLDYMARCALLNGDYKVARRYIRMLNGTMFHKDLARKLSSYIDNPELIKSDPAFEPILPLMRFKNAIGGDGGLVESYISRTIASTVGGPEQLGEMALQFNMILKNIDGFWPLFMNYANKHEKLPVHYQEAAILFSELEHTVDWHHLNIDPQVAERFGRFMDMARKYGNYSPDYNATIFDPQFGDTYWYYYFFINDLKTQ